MSDAFHSLSGTAPDCSKRGHGARKSDCQCQNGRYAYFNSLPNEGSSRPPYSRTGSVDIDFGIVLHANGTVEDTYSVKDGKHGSSKGKLGPSRGLVYRVLDSGSVTRTTDRGTHYHKITVHASGKNCTADVDFILKPGEKEYSDFSSELKTTAYYSSFTVEYVTCVIE